jgi:hypothetical protein
MRRSPWRHNGFLLLDSQSGERRALGGVGVGDGFGEFFSGGWFGDGSGEFGHFGESFGYGGSRWGRAYLFFPGRFWSWEQLWFRGAVAFFSGTAAVASDTAEFGAEYGARHRDRDAGAERDDVPRGGGDGHHRLAVPVARGAHVDQRFGVGAGDLADDHRVPAAGDGVLGAAPDVHGAGSGDGADHRVSGDVRGGSAVYVAGGLDVVRGHGCRGVRVARAAGLPGCPAVE